MRNGIVVQNGQGIGHGNPVITAQSGSLGKDAASIMGHVQTIHSHIQGAAGILFADHIHMALQNDALVVFQAAGAGSKDHHIVALILAIAKAVGLRKGNQVVADGLCIAAPMGDGTYFFKITEYALGLQALQFSFRHSCTLLHTFS